MENNVEKSFIDLTLEPSSDTNSNTKTEYLDEVWVMLDTGAILGFAYDFRITSSLYTITENNGHFAVATVKNIVTKNQPKEKHALPNSIVNRIEKSGTINRSSKLEETRTIKMFDKKAMERKRRLSNSLVYEDTLHSSKQLKKQRLSSSINELTCAQPKNLESQNALSKDEKQRPSTSSVQDLENTTEPVNKDHLQSFVKLTEFRKRKFSYWADHENTETTPENTNKPKLVSEGQTKAHKELNRLKPDDPLDHSEAKKSNCGKKPSTGDQQSKSQKELDNIEANKSDNKTPTVRARDKSEGREETSQGVRTRSRTPTALIISSEMQYNESTCIKKPIIKEAQSKNQKALDDTKTTKKPGDDTQPNVDKIEAKKSTTLKRRARDKSEGREETSEGVRTRSRTPTALLISPETQYNKSTCVKKPTIGEAHSKSQKALDNIKAEKKLGDDTQPKTQESKQNSCCIITDNIESKKSNNTPKRRAKSEGREETSEGVRTRSRTPTSLTISPEMKYNKSTCTKKPVIGEAQSKSQKALDDTRPKKKPGDDTQSKAQVRGRSKSVGHKREETSEGIRTRSRTPTALVINPEFQYNTRAKSTETLCNKTENEEPNRRRTRSKSRSREQKEETTKNQDAKNACSKTSSVKTKDKEAESSHKSGGSKKIESEQNQDAGSRSGRSKNKNPNHMSIRTAQKQKAIIKNKNETETDQEVSQFNKELEKLDAFFSIDTVIDRLIRKNKALLLADEQARLKATKEKAGKASTSTKKTATKTLPSTEKVSESTRKATSSKRKAVSSTDHGKTSADDGKASQGATVEEQLIKNNENYKAWKKSKSIMKSRPTEGSQKLSSLENMKDTNNVQKGKKINNEDIKLKDQNLSQIHKKIDKAANFISEISNIMSLLTLEPEATSSNDQSPQLNLKTIASSETLKVSSKDEGLQSKILKKSGSLRTEEASSKDQGGQLNVKKIASEIEEASTTDQSDQVKVLKIIDTSEPEEANSKDQGRQLNVEKIASETTETNSKDQSIQSVLEIVGVSEFKMKKAELRTLTNEPSSEDQGPQSKAYKNIAPPKTEEASNKDQSLQLKVSDTQEVSKDQSLPSKVLKKTKSSETNQGPQLKILKKFQYSETKRSNPKDEGTQSKASTSVSQSTLEKCNTSEPEATCSTNRDPPLQVLKQIESLETKEASNKDQSIQSKIVKKIELYGTKKSSIKDEGKSKASYSESQSKREKCEAEDQDLQSRILNHQSQQLKILKKIECSRTKKLSIKDEGSKSEASILETNSEPEKCNTSETEGQDLQSEIVKEKSTDQSQQLKILKKIERCRTKNLSIKDEGSKSKASILEMQSEPEKCNTSETEGQDLQSKIVKEKIKDQSQQLKILKKIECSGTKKLSIKDEGSKSKVSILETNSEPEKCNTSETEGQDLQSEMVKEKSTDQSQQLKILKKIERCRTKNLSIKDEGSKSKASILETQSEPEKCNTSETEGQDLQSKIVKEKIKDQSQQLKILKKIECSGTKKLSIKDEGSKSKVSILETNSEPEKCNTSETEGQDLQSEMVKEKSTDQSQQLKILKKIERCRTKNLSIKDEGSKSKVSILETNSEPEKCNTSETEGQDLQSEIVKQKSIDQSQQLKILKKINYSETIKSSSKDKGSKSKASSSESQFKPEKLNTSETEEKDQNLQVKVWKEKILKKIERSGTNKSGSRDKGSKSKASTSESQSKQKRINNSDTEKEDQILQLKVLKEKGKKDLSQQLKILKEIKSSKTEKATGKEEGSLSKASTSEIKEAGSKDQSSHSKALKTVDASTSKTSKSELRKCNTTEVEKLSNKNQDRPSRASTSKSQSESSKSDTIKDMEVTKNPEDEKTNKNLQENSDKNVQVSENLAYLEEVIGTQAKAGNITVGKIDAGSTSKSKDENLSNKRLGPNGLEKLSSRKHSTKQIKKKIRKKTSNKRKAKVYASVAEDLVSIDTYTKQYSRLKQKESNCKGNTNETSIGPLESVALAAEEKGIESKSSKSKIENPTNKVLSSKRHTSKPTNIFSSNSENEKPTSEVLSSKPTNAFSLNFKTEKPTNKVLSLPTSAAKPTNEVLSSKSYASEPNVFFSNCDTENPTNEVSSTKSDASKSSNEVLSSKSDTLKPTNVFSSNSDIEKPTTEVLSPKSDTSKQTNAFSSNSVIENPTNEVLSPKPTSEVAPTQLDIHRNLNIKNFCIPKFKQTFNNNRGVDPKAVDEAAAVIGNVIWSTVGEMMEHFASSLQSSTSSPDVLVSTLKKAFDNVSSRFKNSFENCNENEVDTNILPEVKEVCTNEEDCPSPEDPKKSNDKSSSVGDLKESNDKDCSSPPEDPKKGIGENCSSLEDLKEKNDNCSSSEDPKESIAEVCASLENLLESTSKNCLNLEDPKESIHENVSNLEDTRPKEHSISASNNQTTDVEEEIIEMFHENQICASVDVEVQEVSAESEDASIEDEGASSDCPSANIRLEAVEVSSPPSNVSFELERPTTSTNLNSLLTNQIFADVNVPTEEPENVTQVPEMKCMSCRISKRFPHRSKKYKCACDLLNKKLTENSSGYSNVAQLLDGLVKSDECKLCMLKRRRCNILKPRSSECTCGSASKKFYVIQNSKRNLQQEHSYAESSGLRQYRKKRNLIANMRSVKLLNKKIKSDHSYAAVDYRTFCESPPPDSPVNIDVSPTPSDDINIPIDFNQEIDASAIETTETKTKTTAPKAKSKNGVKFVFLKSPMNFIKRKPRVYLNKKGKQKQTETPKIRLKTKLPEYEIVKTGYTCDKCAYGAKLQDPNVQQKKDLFKGDTELLKSCEICGDIIRSSNTFVNTPVNNSTRHNVFKCYSPKKNFD